MDVVSWALEIVGTDELGGKLISPDILMISSDSWSYDNRIISTIDPHLDGYFLFLARRAVRFPK